MTAAEQFDDEPGFAALTEKIARERRFACGSYKDRCLRRRIAVRMRACRAASYGAYALHLDQHPDEWDRLLKSLTINVTKFFRNRDVFDAIARTVVPALWAAPAPSIRVWSAGCASGEEPYSLAILFDLHAAVTGGTAAAARVQILASDIDEASLNAAREGVYGSRAFAETAPDIRRAYFSGAEPASVAPLVRALVRFERRDLVADPAPPSPFSLIVCRNVLIYFDRPTQERLVAQFHRALAPGGFLVLGKTETIFGPQRDLFAMLDQRARVYQRR